MYNPEDYCSVNVYRNGRGGAGCERKWKIEEYGKKYCTQHSPDKVKERREASDVKYAAKAKVRKVKWALDSGRILACKGVPIEYLKEGILRQLIDFAYEMENEKLIAELES